MIRRQAMCRTRLSFNKSLFLTGGVRYDSFQTGGEDTTYRFTGAYIFPTHTTLRGSYGTGFKVPTLSDLYSSYGSPTLKPEKSNGLDGGVEQSFLNDRLTASTTYFYNSYRDLLDFNDATFKEENIGHAQSQGVELGMTVRPWQTVSVERQLHVHRRARSRHRHGPAAPPVQCRFGPGDMGLFPQGADYSRHVYESDRPDINPTTFAPAHVPAYIVANLATTYRLTDYATLTLRMDNLFNEHYEEVDGFGEPGFAMYGGFKLQF